MSSNHSLEGPFGKFAVERSLFRATMVGLEKLRMDTTHGQICI